MSRENLIILGLVALVPLSILLSVSTGSIAVDWSNVFITLNTGQPTVDYTVVFDLRLPRSLSALVVGLSLALAGVLMQALLSNPLADPYVLGTSGGAATFALLIIILGLPYQYVPVSAGFGAILSIILVFILARGNGDWSSTRLLLTGIVLASGWAAIISFLLAVSSENQIYSMLFWLMGDFREAHPGILRCILFSIVFLFSLSAARGLNLLVSGDLRAEALGVNTIFLRINILIGAGLLTSIAVTLAGAIGFVGLIVPHMMRILVGNDHFRLIPAAALAGGVLLVLTEMLSRTVLAPRQLPVGVITALVGVPLFLYLLRRESFRSYM